MRISANYNPGYDPNAENLTSEGIHLRPALRGGVRQIIQETVENSLLFTGELYDQSELLYRRARYYDPKTGRFVSNEASRLLTITDPLNNCTGNTYDKNGQILTTTDAENNSTAYTYDGSGRIKTVTDALNNTTTYTYDNLGRLQTVTRAGSTITYDYDSEGNITGITYPDGLHLTYTYNQLNLPHTVTDGTHTITYDQAAQPSLETMPNGVTVNYTFDPCGRMTLLENKLNQNILTKSAYTYDQNGNRLSLTNQDNQTTTYTYDSINQLTAVNNNIVLWS